MALGDLTDPAAVLEAVEEFDRLSRTAFLKKYGFGRARSYFLRHEGKFYDSKAIVGAAHGFQYPERGPMRAKDFSGGYATVEAKLRALGFEVVRQGDEAAGDSSNAADMGYWALCANPSMYDIEDAIETAVTEGGVDWWRTKEKPIKAGDRVLIWRTRGSGEHRGVVGLGEVVGAPEVRSDDGNAYWHDAADGSDAEERVPVRYVRPSGLPLWVGSEHHDLIKDLSVARSRGGTVFYVAPDEYAAVAETAGGWIEAPDGMGDKPEDRANATARRGQGRGLNAAERRVVELHAMNLARAHYEQTWSEVRDVSAQASYDLLCRRGGEELRVEVKGTTGGGASVILTANEVRHAQERHPHIALFVVSQIELDRSGEEPSARGGVVAVYEPWDIGACTLRATQYDCVLSTTPPEQPSTS